MRLYLSAMHPGQWVAYGNETGWVSFPAVEQGWFARHAARGLDPIYLREVPVRLAYNTGFPGAPEGQFQHAA